MHIFLISALVLHIITDMLSNCIDLVSHTTYITCTLFLFTGQTEWSVIPS